MARIHPTAIVHKGAKLADDVEVGPFCIIEDDVEIGAGCRLRENVIIRRHTTIGERNSIDPFCVFGGEPQDLKFKSDMVSYVRIGSNNVFREGVTISRATGDGNATVIGNRIYWMCHSHAGHNAVIEDEAILTNCCAVGGHATVGKRAILSGSVLVHQYCWIGEGVITQGNAGFSAHLPPFTIGTDINKVVGLNTVGLHRNPEITAADREQIKEAFRLVYRSGLPTAKSLAEMDARTDWGQPAKRFRDFIRRVLEAKPPYDRGLCQLRARTKG